MLRVQETDKLPGHCVPPRSKNHCFFVKLLSPSVFQLRSEIDKNASPGRSKSKQKFGQHLDFLFDGFWDQLGSMLGGFGLQVGNTNTSTHTSSKPNIDTNTNTNQNTNTNTKNNTSTSTNTNMNTKTSRL